MKSTLAKTETFDAVREILSDCIGVDLEEITPQSTFFDDLDGESIDIIDMMFRCEKRFGVRIELQNLLSELEITPDGTLSQQSLIDLQVKQPEIDWDSRFREITSNNPRNILTVDLICELIDVQRNQSTDAVSVSPLPGKQPADDSRMAGTSECSSS